MGTGPLGVLNAEGRSFCMSTSSMSMAMAVCQQKLGLGFRVLGLRGERNEDHVVSDSGLRLFGALVSKSFGFKVYRFPHWPKAQGNKI